MSWRSWVSALLITAVVFYVCAGVALARMSMQMPRLAVPHNLETQQGWLHDFGATTRDITVSAADGAPLEAWVVTPAHVNGRGVILLHGVGTNRGYIASFADFLLRAGYVVLIPDSRAHGASGGEVATYGLLEREDVHRWAAWLRTQVPGCTYLLGESMGAAIGLQAMPVTPQLCAVAVEDPYATFREVSYERMAATTGTSPFFWKTAGRPIIEVAILWARVRYGVWLTDASPKSAIERSSVPALLIAGTKDINIPMHHAQELESACGSRCALWIVEGADHGGASDVAGEEFEQRVLAWFGTHDRGV